MDKRNALARAASYAREFGTVVYAWTKRPFGEPDVWYVGSVRPVWACDWEAFYPPGWKPWLGTDPR